MTWKWFFVRQYTEFRVQQEAIEELKKQFSKLQKQVQEVTQNEGQMKQENEGLKDQLANMSHTMNSLKYKVRHEI